MTLPLETLHIRAFRGLRDIKLEGLGRINLLVGANNSGKTSVLEAIYLFSRPMDPFAWLETAASRSSDPALGSPSKSLEWLFPQHGSSGMVAESEQPRIEIAGTGNTETRHLRAIIEFLRGSPPTSGESADSRPVLQPAPASLVLDNATRIAVTVRTERRSLESEFTWWERTGLRELSLTAGIQGPAVQSAFIDSRDRMPSGLAGSNRMLAQLREVLLDEESRRSLVGMLRVFDTRVRDILYVPEPSEIRIETEGLPASPISTFGDGLRRAFEVALAFADARNGILLIDELEAAIHPDGLRPFLAKLLEACKLGNVQLFATTHSLETVDALAAACEDEPDDTLTLYRLEGSDTKRPVVRMSKSEMRIMRHSFGAEVR